MDRETLAGIRTVLYDQAEGQGTGLGLAVVYGIVKQSGGYIWADSEPGQGTTFTILLPRVAEETEPQQERPSASPPISSGHEVVLVVEDELMVRELIVRLLERLGYICLEAEDGVEGLEVLEAALDRGGHIDLVVTDLLMPRMNGRELAERVAQLQPRLPVLFMSGYTDDEMVRQGLLAPGADFIQKPFEAERFATKLQMLLKRHA